MTERSFGAKEIIFRDGDRADLAYIVMDGKVELLTSGARGEQVIATKETGSVFGEQALLAETATRPYTARAVVPSRLFAISAQEFKPHLDKLPEVVAPFIRLFMDTLRVQYDRPAQQPEKPAVPSIDIKKITVAPASEALSKQMPAPVSLTIAQLPYRVGGFAASGESQPTAQNHLNISSDGPPLTVSRQHCEILVENDALGLLDLGSRFCTVVNGKTYGRGHGQYTAPLQKGKNEVILGGPKSDYKLLITCE